MGEDVERLEAELAMAKQAEKLEAAREAMHADRNPKTVEAYKRASEATHKARRRWREDHRVTSTDPADASPAVETIEAKARSDRP